VYSPSTRRIARQRSVNLLRTRRRLRREPVASSVCHRYSNHHRRLAPRPCQVQPERLLRRWLPRRQRRRRRQQQTRLRAAAATSTACQRPQISARLATTEPQIRKRPRHHSGHPCRASAPRPAARIRHAWVGQRRPARRRRRRRRRAGRCVATGRRRAAGWHLPPLPARSQPPWLLRRAAKAAKAAAALSESWKCVLAVCWPRHSRARCSSACRRLGASWGPSCEYADGVLQDSLLC
jgi:hypothetical protein